MAQIWHDTLSGLRSALHGPRVPAFAVLTLALAIGASTALLTALIPALQASRTDPLTVLRAD